MSKQRNHIVLVRGGWPNRERFIQLVAGNGYTCWVDPCREVSEAVGWAMNRHSCIVSFADGLVAAGKEVIISENFFGQPKHYALHANRLRQEELREKVKPIYFYFGVAWGSGQWLSLKQQLQQIAQPHRRQEIFLETAQCLVEQHLAKKPRSSKTGRLSWPFTAEEKALVLSRVPKFEKPVAVNANSAVAGEGVQS